jgi:hypothetical protein
MSVEINQCPLLAQSGHSFLWWLFQGERTRSGRFKQKTAPRGRLASTRPPLIISTGLALSREIRRET